MSKGWGLIIQVDKGAAKPIFQQIAEEVIRHISDGRLKAGTLLPGTRTLALQLGLNRNTISEAYGELTAQGWIESAHGRGTFVANTIPDTLTSMPKQKRKSLATPSFEVEKGILLNLDDGSPDSRLFPIQAFARSFGRVSRRLGSRIYERRVSPKGSDRLRTGLAGLLNVRRALSVSENDILVTRGSQHAIFLVGHILGKNGGLIGVESPGYMPAQHAFEAGGLQSIEIPVDDEGLVIEALESVLKSGRKLNAVYTTPHHQFPTTVTLKADRRLRLLELAEKYGFWIIEDDYDHDFHFDSKPVLPLASMGKTSRVIYISSLSKLLTPGLRIGYLIAPSSLLEELTRTRSIMDRMGDPILEESIAELLEDGELQRHANKMRAIYKERRDRFVSSLEEKSTHSASFKSPSGGTAIWLNLPNAMTYKTFSKLMTAKGVTPLSESLFTVTKGKGLFGTRIGYASLNEKEIDLATSAIASVLRKGVR